jgi:hypothetical protein
MSLLAATACLPSETEDVVAAAREYILTNNINDVDLESGQIIGTADEYWDVSFVMPGAVESGLAPDHRIFRVHRPDMVVEELPID